MDVLIVLIPRLGRRQAAYGKDDLETLLTISNLTNRMRRLGDYAVARELDEDTFARSRRVLGDEHIETLRSASNLAHDLLRLGDLDAAREQQR